MNKIIVNRDKFKVDDIELVHGELSIGRENDNDLHFDHPYLSGHHAKIITLFDASHIEDLDSTNGTYVNGQPITKHTLHNGDVITFGDYRIMFSSDARQASTSDHQETMILNSDDLMKKLKASESVEQHEHATLPDISVTESSQTQATPRPTPSADDLEFLRKMEEKLKQNNQSTEHATTAKNAQRPVLHTSREQLFKRKEEKKRLLSPVTVYILTVASICIVALLLLPYIPA